MPKGTPEQFLDVLYDKIDELSTMTINSAESVDVVSDDKEPIYGEYGSPYIDELMTRVMDYAPCPITNWTISGDTLYIDVDEGMDDGEDASTYEVPIGDLVMDYDAIYKDVNYIVDSLCEECY